MRATCCPRQIYNGNKYVGRLSEQITKTFRANLPEVQRSINVMDFKPVHDHEGLLKAAIFHAKNFEQNAEHDYCLVYLYCLFVFLLICSRFRVKNFSLFLSAF